nr:hypothetical protein [Tanacetum cinerariifolium]
MSSFVSSMLNPISDVGVESIFTTTSSPIVSLESPTPIMTPSTIATITTSGEAPIPPPIIPSIILENLPTFNSAFRFEERLRLLETSFSEYRQTNQFADAVSAIPEMELKKILIEKMEGNKSIQRSDEQRNLYKAQKEGGEQASASTPSEKATEGAGESTTGSQSQQMSASKSTFAEEPVQTTCQMEETPHLVFETARQTDARSSFNKLLDTPIDFSNFIMHRLNVDTLTPDLLVGPTYELMRGSCTSLTELEYHLEEVYKATTDQLDWVNPEGQQYPHNLLQPLPLIPDHRGRQVIPVDTLTPKLLAGPTYELMRGSCNSLTELEYHLEEVYKARTDQLDWVNPEGQQYPHNLLQPLPFIPDHRGRRVIPFAHFINNDLEYLQGAACGRSLTGSQKLPEEAQPYQARHVPIRSKATRSVYCLFEPKRTYLSKQGQENRLMRIDELNKFSDGTLNDVRNALDDRLKGIRMQYLPQTIWRKGDKDRAAAMIQAIEKMLKTRRIMRSLEQFVGGRLYKGDFQML